MVLVEEEIGGALHDGKNAQENGGSKARYDTWLSTRRILSMACWGLLSTFGKVVR